MLKYFMTFALLGTTFGGITMSFSSEPATLPPPTVEEILSCFERQTQKLLQPDCFLLSYTRTVGNELLKKESMPQVHYVNGHLKDTWVVEASLVNEDSSGLKRKIQYFVKNGVIWEWRETSNTGVVVKFGDGRNIYQNWYYFQNCGITPYRVIAESNGLNFPELLESAKTSQTLFPLNNELLPDCLKNNLADYHVRIDQENVESHPCWVIERQGIDTIWVDPSCGNAIRKRITHWGPNEPLKVEVYNRKLREIEPGLYLPWEQEVTHYIGREMEMKESLFGKPLYRFTYVVDDLQIGNLDATAQAKFVLQPAVGTSVLDVRTEEHYTIAKEGSDPFAGPLAQAFKLNRYVVIRSICIIVGSVLIFLAVWLHLRKQGAA